MTMAVVTRTPAELAERLSVPAAVAARLLDEWASVRVVTRDGDGRYALTIPARLLYADALEAARPDAPVGLDEADRRVLAEELDGSATSCVVCGGLLPPHVRQRRGHLCGSAACRKAHRAYLRRHRAAGPTCQACGRELSLSQQQRRARVCSSSCRNRLNRAENGRQQLASVEEQSDEMGTSDEPSPEVFCARSPAGAAAAPAEGIVRGEDIPAGDVTPRPPPPPVQEGRRSPVSSAPVSSYRSRDYTPNPEHLPPSNLSGGPYDAPLPGRTP